MKTIIVSKYFLFALMVLFAGDTFAQKVDTAETKRVPGLTPSTTVDSKTEPDTRTGTILRTDNKVQSSVAQYGGGRLPIRVVNVYLTKDPNSTKGGLGDEITVVVDSLSLLISESEKDVDKSIILYIDNNPLKGLYYTTNVENNEIYFRLDRGDSANTSWQRILSKPSFFSGSKLVMITVGTERSGPYPTAKKDKNFTLVIVRALSFWFCFIIIIALFIILLFLGKRTELLREPFYEQGSSIRPYSLALTQMAFWYFLVIAAFIMLSLITKDFPAITGSVLALIGISSLTGLSATAINFSRINDLDKKSVKLQAEKQMLEKSITGIKSSLAKKELKATEFEIKKEIDDKTVRLNEIIQEIPKFSKMSETYMSRGFFKDLVSDSTGVSLHRFQIAVWTLVLGGYFCYSVWSNLAMPSFDETLLALMGISSGTYIGFKIPEQKLN